MDKVHVIVNPVSARGQTGKRWKEIQNAISSYFREFRYIFTEKQGQATEIARGLLRDGYDFIIGVGGDGTLNEIASGFFSSKTGEAINQDASIGIIPSGTGSDFVRFMRIPRDLSKTVSWLRDAPKQKIDIGTIKSSGGTGHKGERFFVNVADFGLGAEVIRRVSSVPVEKRGRLFYYKGFVSTLLGYRPKRCKVVIDGRETIQGNFLIGAVANGGIFGGGMIIAPNARINDGYFDLVLIEEMNKIDTIWSSRLLYSGRIDRHHKVRTIRAKKISVTSDDNVHLECDGESGGTLPAEFEIREKAINLRFQ